MDEAVSESLTIAKLSRKSDQLDVSDPYYGSVSVEVDIDDSTDGGLPAPKKLQFSSSLCLEVEPDTPVDHFEDIVVDPYDCSRECKLLIKAVPMTDGVYLSELAVEEHFLKFGMVLRVTPYAIATGSVGHKVALPGHYLVEFSYDLGLNSALSGGKVQKISATVNTQFRNVNIKLFKYSRELQMVIEEKTRGYRLKKLERMLQNDT